MTPDLSQPCKIHVLGVGGAGMSAIAEVLVSMGHTVTGSDLKESAGLDRLRALGVVVTVGPVSYTHLTLPTILHV